ncbi:MAG TPA: hypothetical protein VII63_04280 [Caulobacteraceae bacterium]
MTKGELIVVTGPAAAGKTTVAKALQARFAGAGELWLLIELDAFGRSTPRDWMSLGEHRGRHAARGFAYERATDGRLELNLGPDGRRVLAAFHRSVAAVVKSGVNVICETIVHDDDDWRDWSRSLRGIRVCWVKLSAPPAVLEAREKADRAPLFQGLARGMTARQPVGAFDVEADTSTEDASAIVNRIAAARDH